MSIDLQHPFDDELRGILENLASGLFPLTDWISDPNRKFKPHEKGLPWREGGHSLSPKDIGVIPFLEALIRETSADAHLIARWQDLAAGGNALKFSPIADMQLWRSERNFDPAPSFGIIAGENVLLADGQPMSRAGFYGDYLPLLRQAAQAAAAPGPIDWKAFASALFTDQSTFWPQGQPRKSSVFIVQFVKDMLYAMLGMRNDASAPWKFALLIELGEHRRVGNAYEPGDAKKAVSEYKKVLKQLLHPPPSAGPGIAATVIDPTPGMPPVGSPPVNHKIHI